MFAWPHKPLEAGKGCFRFPRTTRLSDRKEFKRVFECAKKSVDQCFTVLFADRVHEDNQQDYPRLGMAITKKIVKRAVDRNRIKRIVRESFRLNQHRLGMIDIVILARRNVFENTNQQLFISLDKHWSQLENQCQGK